MLLYSATLGIRDTLGRDDFVRMIIQWNQGSPHESNIIPDLQWNGERNVRFGDENRWLAIEEYRNRDIIAARFEKKESDGAIWDTDYIMNFETMKMTIQLDRVYTEDAEMENFQFSTPHFITMLIEGGYLQDDNGLPVLRQAIVITQENLSVLTDIVNKKKRYRMPVVYVSKTVYNRDPVNAGWLCSRLKGAAHVLLEQDKSLDAQLREACRDDNEYAGGIEIYFPNGKLRRFYYRRYANSDDILLNKVVQAVFQYTNAQRTPILSTWQGVNNAMLTDRCESQRIEKLEAEQARRKAEDEVEHFVEAFDADNQRLRQQIENLTRAVTSLQMENQGLREKISETAELPILFLGAEEEFYPDEIREMILDCVAEKLKNLRPQTRRWDVLRDILQSNGYRNIGDERERIVKTIFKDYKNLSGTVRQQLQELGFEITEEGKHYRLTYYGDGRYKTTIAKSGSDWREGKNIAAVIKRDMM